MLIPFLDLKIKSEDILTYKGRLRSRRKGQMLEKYLMVPWVTSHWIFEFRIRISIASEIPKTPPFRSLVIYFENCSKDSDLDPPSPYIKRRKKASKMLKNQWKDVFQHYLNRYTLGNILGHSNPQAPVLNLPGPPSLMGVQPPLQDFRLSPPLSIISKITHVTV